jgi:predicted TIM-barrel fold metal-dependent hydrolase
MTDAAAVSEPIVVISSDGHASARMAEYKPYLESRWHAEFDDFCKLYDEIGSRNFEPRALEMRLDAPSVAEWEDRIAPDRLEGNYEPDKRLIEVEKEGIVGEVLFPDFGLPFELNSPLRDAVLNTAPRTPERIEAANRAYTRWLVDFCNYAPERFAGMAPISFTSFHDVDAALEQIRWAKDAGLKGIVPPMFNADFPLYHSRFDPIWAELSELDMVVNAHAAISGVRQPDTFKAPLPHPAIGFPMLGTRRSGQDLLAHFIWGGVLQRFPKLKVVLSELTSGWVIAELASMDYSYDGSYLSHDIREVMPLRPSDYYERQCFLGSSTFSKAEVEARHKIGVGKMMLGIDYPHHEGAWNGGTKDYFQATLGACEVPEEEARLLLGKTAADVFGFDYEALSVVAARVGPTADEILTPPTEDKFPRGDVHKPL